MNITNDGLNNIILNTDSYKISMPRQYPPGTTKVFSYIESRGGLYDRLVFFGLQAFIKQYLEKPITKEDIDLAEEIWPVHGEPFDRKLWDYILTVHGGKLPVVIRAVPEGIVVPNKNVLVTIENTDRGCFWLTTHIETALLRAIWYPTTVATTSWKIKGLINKFLEETGDPAGLPFKLHDFGARGVSSFESAGIGGMAHLVNFMGTDTMTGILFARKFYNAGIAGFSIPAAEHSTITSWLKENEAAAYENMLDQFAKPGAIVAVVSDSYDVFNAAANIWGGKLKAKVQASGSIVVIRPDSGDPVAVNVNLIAILGDKFGWTVNEKGYKVLNNVRLIQGDGVNYDSINAILTAFKRDGWSADNIAFGMGGALLQKVDRDTQKFAMKCSAINANGEWFDVMKDPITDKGKTSKPGRVNLWKNELGEFVTSVSRPGGYIDAMNVVFENGVLKHEISFPEVRENASFL